MAKDVKVREEKIAEMKTIVYKTLVDPSTVKLIGEREKVKLFTKMGFLKPNPEDVQLDSLEKLYDPFFIINGRYFIDYYRKKVYKLDVEEDVSELLILNQVFTPKTPTLAKLRGKVREVELEAEQRIIKENSAYTVLDKKGKEVELERFSAAPAEEDPKKVLNEAGERVFNLQISPKKAIAIFRSKVINRPPDAERITRELFEVSENNLVYVPIYQVTYKNVKNKHKKSVKVNGVTSKLLSRQPASGIRTRKIQCSKCGKPNEENAKFCRKCGSPL